MSFVPLALVLACVDPDDDTGARPVDTDTGAEPDTDTDADSDTDTDTDTDTAVDTDTGGDTGMPALPGTLEVTGTFGGVPFAFACGEADSPERFRRYWSSSVGNISGTIGCFDASSLSVSFINPAAGTWTAPADGMNYFYGDASGTWLSYYDAPPTAWEMTLDEVVWVGPETLSITGSVSGAWDAGDVRATFAVQVPCIGCD